MRISDWSSDVCSSDLSIVEKETGKPSERRTVAAVYSNRLKRGMPLQADPTVIYPITHGKPLGRRILRSELEAKNGYNTYAMAGLPEGPICNRSEEHTSELQSLMRISYAVYGLQKKHNTLHTHTLASFYFK